VVVIVSTMSYTVTRRSRGVRVQVDGDEILAGSLLTYSRRAGYQRLVGGITVSFQGRWIEEVLAEAQTLFQPYSERIQVGLERQMFRLRHEAGGM